MQNIEIWKDIVGYEGHYQVSTLGNVRSLSRYLPHKNTQRFYAGKILKQKNHKGYRSVHLRSPIESWTSVHRLLALAFILNPENKPTVNHKDGIKSNNILDNLEWATDSEQMLHAISTGLYNPPDLRPYVLKGENNKQAKIKNKDIPEIKKLREQGKTYKVIAELFNVGISQIFRICKNESRLNG